jgi:hypothetical protein
MAAILKGTAAVNLRRCIPVPFEFAAAASSADARECEASQHAQLAKGLSQLSRKGGDVRIAATVPAIRRSLFVVVWSLGGPCWMTDEHRNREASSRPSVSGRDGSRLEPGGGEGETPASAEDRVRRQARAAIHAGMLPRKPPVSVWGGPGSGASCAVCGSTVARDGHGFELEFRDAIGRLERRYIHIPCFAAWDLECRSLLQADGNGCTISDRERVES